MIPQAVDVLMIQPPVTKKQALEDPVIEAYFTAVDKNLGTLVGDSPYEINWGLKGIAEYILYKNPDTKIKMLDLNFMDRDKRSEGMGFLTPEDAEAAIVKYKPKITLLSFMTQSYAEWGCDLAQAARKVSDYVFVGGIHPTVQYHHVMADLGLNIDGVIVGEGEKICQDLVANFDDIDRLIENNDSILTWEKYGSPRIPKDYAAPVRATISEADFQKAIPSRYDLFKEYKDKISVRINTSWGCVGECGFCSVGSFFKKCGVRRKTVDQIMNEIRALDRLNLSDKQFVFGDLCMFDDSSLSNELLERMIKLKLSGRMPYQWWCQTRADKVTKELCEKLKEAGCKQVAIGCESGSDEQLQKISKGVTVAQIKDSLKMIRDADMETQCYWIIGLPGDSFQAVRQTQNKIIEYLKEDLCTVPHISTLVPYPGTPLFCAAQESAVLSGIDIRDYDFENYWMNCDRHGCGKPVYNTVGETGKILLDSDQIYDLWLDTLQKVTDFANKKSRN